MAAGVAIVGGGPAGASAAIALARGGLDVVVFERERGEPDRFCGEFLSPDGVGSLDALGVLSDVLAERPAVLSRWRVSSSRGSIEGVLPAPALGLSRARFDSLLRRVARTAGAEVREGVRVAAVESARSGFVIRGVSGEATFEADARHVVGALGRAGRVPGLSSGSVRVGTDYIGMKAHFSGRVDADSVSLFPLGGAYVGVAPVEKDTVNVCFLARRGAFDRAGRDPQELLERGARKNAAFAEVWKSLERVSERYLATAGMTFAGRIPVAESGALLCGDAAAFAAPFLGEGMAIALESGRLAARRIEKAFEAPSRAGEQYAREWRRAFAPRLRAGEWLQGLLLSEHGASAVLECLRRFPAVSRAIVRRTRSADLVARSRRNLGVGVGVAREAFGDSG
jgi:flavin-dependent dehydrogenase